MNCYQQAKKWVDLGIAVIPTQYKTKLPKVEITPYHDRLPTDLDLRRWFGGGSLQSYAVVLGWQNLTVIDFDDMQMWYEWQLWSLEQDNDLIPALSYRVETNRGMHVYCAIKERGVNMHHPRGLDVKYNGLATGPGSTHKSGKIYQGINDFVIIGANSIDDVLPAEWLDTMRKSSLSLTGQKEPVITSDPFETATNAVIPGGPKVERIKSNWRIQDLVPDAQDTGGGYMLAKCFAHDDNSPSLWIDTKRQICNCFVCNWQKPADVIDVYAAMRKISIQDAIKEM